MKEELPTHNQFESNVLAETTRKHSEEIEIMRGLINTYIDGFNLINSFTHEEGKNDVEYVSIHLVMHSLHSMWCAIRLMLRGYYAQTMALLRMAIEDWFICGDCKLNQKALDAVLYGKYRIPSMKECLTFKQMAIRMNALLVYEQDYAHASKFSHPSSLGMAILRDEETNLMRIAPTYEDIIFLDCCEMWIRNAIRMTANMEDILSYISDTKVRFWRDSVGSRVKAADDWLKILQEKHGGKTDIEDTSFNIKHD